MILDSSRNSSRKDGIKDMSRTKDWTALPCPFTVLSNSIINIYNTKLTAIKYIPRTSASRHQIVCYSQRAAIHARVSVRR